MTVDEVNAAMHITFHHDAHAVIIDEQWHLPTQKMPEQRVTSAAVHNGKVLTQVQAFLVLDGVRRHILDHLIVEFFGSFFHICKH